MVTIKEIAEEAGVSVSTVSRYLNKSGYVKKETAERIKRIIEKHNFVRSNIARSLVLQKSHTIGLVLPHINSPFFASVATGVESEIKKHDYEMIICHTREDAEAEKRMILTLRERRVDGIILLPTERSTIHIDLKIGDIPTVFIARYYDDMPYSAVYVDNAGGSKRIINLLIQHGHRDIALIIGRKTYTSGKQRWEGALQALEEANITPNPALMKECSFTAEGGYKAMKEILATNKKFTAVFAGNHLISAGCMRAIFEEGLSVPDDIVMTAFEGFEDSFAEFIMPEIVTHNIHPSRQMGAEAVKILMKEINGEIQPGQHLMLEMGLKIQSLRKAL
jgi:LacI family transcriptional regulator